MHIEAVIILLKRIVINVTIMLKTKVLFQLARQLDIPIANSTGFPSSLELIEPVGSKNTTGLWLVEHLTTMIILVNYSIMAPIPVFE